jgi:UPF0042 nucleotide-binding protein
MRLVIISGLSGSGKSVALHTLEDTGFYCIDNLPIVLLREFGRHIKSVEAGDGDRYAVGIDARNQRSALTRFPEIVTELRELGIHCETLFLQTERDTLIKRFSETRRRHPLSDDQLPLAEAIEEERQLLSPIVEQADLIIDTTLTTVHQLRELVRERMVRAPYSLSLLFESFGHKHGVPSDADFVFDVRCLPNPHWEPELRRFTGRDEPVATYLAGHDTVNRYVEQLIEFLEEWVPAFERENRSYLTVAFGCTGGQHRSVYVAERLAEHFRGTREHVSVRHRELS